MFKSLLLAILLVLPIAANAHSPLASSSPQNGETLDEPPTEIFMEFKLPAKLIKVDLRRQSDKQGKGFLGGLFGSYVGVPVGLQDRFQLSLRILQEL